MGNKILKFLIVDDESTYLESWKDSIARFFKDSTFSGQEISIETANSYPKAIQSLLTETFDLVLLDHQLGRSGNCLTGADIISHLRNAEDGDALYGKFLVLTAIDDFTLREKYAQLGSLGHCTKPVHYNHFKDTFADALIRCQLTDRKQRLVSATAALEIVLASGIYKPIEELEVQAAEAARLKVENTELKELNQGLLTALSNTNTDSDKIKVYDEFLDKFELLMNSPARILSVLRGYDVLCAFLDDIVSVYRKDFDAFTTLVRFLGKGGGFENGQGKIQHIVETKYNDQWEVYIGKHHRLYYRMHSSRIVLERFGHKKDQARDHFNFLRGDRRNPCSDPAKYLKFSL